MPWPRFWRKESRDRSEVRGFGGEGTSVERGRLGGWLAGRGGGVSWFKGWIEEHVEDGLNRDLREWRRNTIASVAMLRCDGEEFKTRQDSLLGVMLSGWLDLRLML